MPPHAAPPPHQQSASSAPRFVCAPPCSRYERRRPPGAQSPIDHGTVEIAVDGGRPDAAGNSAKDVFSFPKVFVESVFPEGIPLDSLLLDTATTELFPENIATAIGRTVSLVLANEVSAGVSMAEGRGIIVKRSKKADGEGHELTIYVEGMKGYFWATATYPILDLKHVVPGVQEELRLPPRALIGTGSSS